MFSSLYNHLFGSYTEESPDSLAETVVSEPNSDDWVLVDSNKQNESSVTGSSGQSIEAAPVAGPSNQSLQTFNKAEDDLVDEDKENDSSDDASSISSLSESSANEFDSEGEPLEYLVPKLAKKVKKPRKPRIIVDDQHGINAGLMDGSWFVTPPPCFIRHKKSKKHQIPSSPMEDMLIEHPSISVYQANTSTNSPTKVPNTTPFDYLIEAFDYFPTLTAISKNIAWPEWHSGPTKIKVPAACFIYKPAPSTQRQSSKKRNCSKKSHQNSHNSNSTSTSTTNSNIFNLRPEVNQLQGSRDFRAINTNPNHHDRNEYLHEINNLQYNLAPMQKAMNQGSQKFLKKSFLNRQNLVKFRSERQRFTQRPKCHPLKMC